MRVTRDVVLPVSAAEAWRLLTDEGELGQWLGVPLRLDLQPGGAAAFVDEEGAVRHAVIDVVDDEHRLGFVWWTDERDPSRVDFRIEETEAGTKVVVTEEAPVRASVAGGIRRFPIGAFWSDRLFDLEVTVLSRSAVGCC